MHQPGQVCQPPPLLLTAPCVSSWGENLAASEESAPQAKGAVVHDRVRAKREKREINLWGKFLHALGYCVKARSTLIELMLNFDI